jgi:hypothetical protein
LIGTILLPFVIAATTLGAEPDTDDLIEQLASEDFDDRVSACKALERRGAEVLPALRAAVVRSDNSRLRSQAALLRESIARQMELDRISRPTSVQLDFRDRPLGAIVDTLNARHRLGLAVQLDSAPERGQVVFDPDAPRRLERAREQRVTLVADDPVPFWEAIDRLCETARMHYRLSDPQNRHLDRGVLVLMPDRTGRGPVSDSGPFRVQVTRVDAVYENDFSSDSGATAQGARPSNDRDLIVSLAIFAEPGLSLQMTGPIAIEDARDEKDRSLLLPASTDSEVQRGDLQRIRMSGPFLTQVRVKLQAAAPVGTTIRQIRGRIPVVAFVKHVDPLVISLKRKDDLETPFQAGEKTISVTKVNPDPEDGTFDVTLTPNRDATAPANRREPSWLVSTAASKGRELDALELYDDKGVKIPLQCTQRSEGIGDTGKFTRLRVSPWTVFDGPADAAAAVRPDGEPSRIPVPAELRYYESSPVTTEIPFDLRDIPIP